MGALDRYMSGLVMANSPDLMAEYLAEKRAKQFSAATPDVMGRPSNMPPQGQQGLMTPDQVMNNKGTGLFDDTVPVAERLMRFNRRAGISDSPAYQQMMINNLKGMHSSSLQDESFAKQMEMRDANDLRKQERAFNYSQLENLNADKSMDIKDLTGINNKVTDLTKETQGIYRGAKTLEGLKQRGTPASQVAATFAFMKSIDPSSTVRESELGMVYEAEGAAKQIASMLNKMLGEGSLTASNFADLVDTAKIMANTAIDSSNNEIGGFLSVYGDRMRPQTVKKLSGRLPSKFKVSLTDEQLDAAIAAEEAKLGL